MRKILESIDNSHIAQGTQFCHVSACSLCENIRLFFCKRSILETYIKRNVKIKDFYSSPLVIEIQMNQVKGRKWASVKCNVHGCSTWALPHSDKPLHREESDCTELGSKDQQDYLWYELRNIFVFFKTRLCSQPSEIHKIDTDLNSIGRPLNLVDLFKKMLPHHSSLNSIYLLLLKWI